VFLAFVGAEGVLLPELVDEIQRELARTVWTVVDGDDTPRVRSLGLAGFGTEIVLARFSVPFELAMSAVRRAWVPGDLRLITADLAVEERLFELDVEIRNNVPGTEGWQGDRAWFHGELTDDRAFDPSAYLVAVEEGTGDYVGLVRFWRNPGGPRLGLVGVTRGRRGSVLAAALLHRAMRAASTWGFATFATETARTNRSTRPLLARLGVEPCGRDLLMARSDEGRSAKD
jgi:GNAT superfamily N-acetyltransferase